METAVVWFRDDLRVTDNSTLSDAVDAAERVVPLYVYDPSQFGESEYGPEKTGRHRARFRRESVLDLRESIQELGGELFVRRGDPEEVVPDVAGSADAEAVYAQTKPATEELRTEEAVRNTLEDRNVAFERRWTHTLYHLNDLPTPYDVIEDTFTPWRKAVEAETDVREPIPEPDAIRVPDEIETGAVPTLTELGLGEPPDDDRAVLRFEGGETAGKARVQRYVWDGDHLRSYKRTRNGLLGPNYSSKLSPWLAAGCLSPRWIHREVDRYEAERVSNEGTYWLVFELAWRDFFQFQFLKHGGSFFTPGGIRDVDVGWDHDRETFRRWADGETGIPFVDANMRELNRTGYMSNRGRQNVASFLADALNVDWRWGAAHFEAKLVDYDVASNWGNWAYQAGVGNDSRDRYFDVLSQAERYDPDGEYVRTWLPELDGLPAASIHRPWTLSTTELAECGIELGVEYPEPMLDLEARYRAL